MMGEDLAGTNVNRSYSLGRVVLIRVRVLPLLRLLAGQPVRADAATEGNTARLAPALIQPVAADDVARAMASVSVGPPVNGIGYLTPVLYSRRGEAGALVTGVGCLARSTGGL